MIKPCSSCGAEVEIVRGWAAHAHLRTTDHATGLYHHCPALVIPDIVECGYCGRPIKRYPDGRRLERNGQPHVCKRAA
jgi:hypothetical protein